ncbi:MAG: DUF4238 domain-containing protein [Parvibaculum sp.]|nr:DUF4238 domain-containing protein [Parvibaculum sp.]
MAEAHNHHYVPQGYLRGFAAGVGRQAKLHVIDIKDRRAFSTLVRNVASRRDFNRLDIDGVEPNALEKAYGQFESQASEAIKRIATSRTFVGEDRVIIINLLAMLIIRNPRMRDNWAGFMDRLWRLTGDMMVAKRERWEAITRQMKNAGYDINENVSYEQMRDFVRGGEYDIVTDRHVHIRLEIETLDKVTRMLASRNWRLSIVPDHLDDLITCDHPVCLISTVKRPDGLLGGVGYGMTHTAVLFPLTRRISLWGSFEDREEVVEMRREQVAFFNTHLIRNAERQIYALNDDFDYVWNRQLHRGTTFLEDLKRGPHET